MTSMHQLEGENYSVQLSDRNYLYVSLFRLITYLYRMISYDVVSFPIKCNVHSAHISPSEI